MNKVLKFLSYRGAYLSGTIMKKILNSDLITLKKYSTQDYVYLATFGVEALYLRILAPIVTLLADLILLIAFTATLIVVNPVSAIATLLILIIVALVLNMIQRRKVKYYGKEFSKKDIESRIKLAEAINSLSEIKVRNRQEYIFENFLSDRVEVAKASAFNNLIAYSNKYIIE